MHMDSNREKDKRTVEVQSRINAVIEIPAPREVPADILKQATSPIASFLAVFMTLMGLFPILLYGILAALQPQRVHPWALVPLGIIVVTFLSIAAWAVRAKRQTRAILTWGQRYKGKVLQVRQLPARINARSFFRVVVGFADANGTNITGQDTVDNWAVDYFLGARDEEQEVDLIYHPRVRHRVVLPMKMALGRRFD
jgi:hypothetical protein